MGYLMTDLDGDLIFQTTLELEANSHYNFKYRIGESFNWEGSWENVPSECAEGQYSDRYIDTNSSDIILEPVCFASCEICETDQELTNVTFQVNMSGVDVSSEGVFLHGNWFNWGTIEMTDSDGDCIYETTMEIASGTNGEYIFKNGTENEQVPEECENINNWGGGVNRLITVSDEDTILSPICYQQCENSTCQGECSNLGNIEINKLPISFELLDPYPNPFNPITNISYALPEDNVITIDIYDIEGKNITTLIDGLEFGGNHTVEWNAENYPSGVYFVKFNSDNFSQTQKLMLIK